MSDTAPGVTKPSKTTLYPPVPTSWDFQHYVMTAPSHGAYPPQGVGGEWQRAFNLDQGVGGGPKVTWHLALFAFRAAWSSSTPQTRAVTIGTQPEEGAPWQEGVGCPDLWL